VTHLSKLHIVEGNAASDGAGRRGWFVGHFMPAQDLRHTEDVETKWGIHKKGERRIRWARGEETTSIAILVHGQLDVEFPDRTVRLRREGDYVMWGPGIPHKWQARQKTVALTVRWPSKPC